MRQVLQHLVLIGSGLLIGGGICEFGLRLFVLLQAYSTEPQDQEAKTPKGLTRREQRTGWIPRTGAQQEHTDVDGRPYVVRINSTGQRGGEVGTRQPEQRRILFLGDSFTLADQVREEDTFVTQVGTRLRAAGYDQVQVINGGVNGYSTYQELAYYRYYGRPLEPDIVVLCFFAGNDFRDNMIATRQGRLLNPVLIPKPERFWGHQEPILRTEDEKPLCDPLWGDLVPQPSWEWVGWLERHSLLARLVGSRYARLKGRWSGDLGLIDLNHRYYFYEIGLYQRRDDGFFHTARELTLECVAQLRRLVREDGAELLVVLLPSQYQVDQHKWQEVLGQLSLDEDDLGELDWDYPHRLVRAYCAGSQIPCLDLREAFAASERVSDLFLTVIDDGHFSALGHRLAAEEITAFLRGDSVHLGAPVVLSYRRGLGYLYRGDFDRAEQALLAGIEQEGALAALHVALGNLYRQRERWLQAQRAYRQALDIDPASAKAWEGLAEVLMAGGDRAAALISWKRAVQAQPEWWPYWQELEALYTELGMMQEAEEARRRVEAELNSPGPIKRYWWAEHVSRGTDYAAQEKWQNAECEFGRAVRFIPDEPISLYNLGLLYHRTGRLNQAASAYRKVLSLAPDFTLAAERLRELGRGR